MPLIMDQSLSPFLLGALAETAALVIALVTLYFGTSGDASSTVFVYGTAISFASYMTYMVYLGFASRSAGRSFILSQGRK